MQPRGEAGRDLHAPGRRRAVAAGADLAAAAPYYGVQPPAADVPRIKARLLLHYAQNDDRINAGIPAYREALDKAGVK